MTLSLHNNNTKKAPYFDGINYAYWKVKMTAHLKSINKEVWKVTETKFEVANENAPTPVEEKKLQCNDISTIIEIFFKSPPSFKINGSQHTNYKSNV